jgi:hypothetical protein
MKKITLILWMALLALGGSAQISRYIKVTATGAGDGTSWANAAGTANIQTIIDEVEAATNQGTVYFAAGTYLIPAQIQLKNNVQLMGGYAADGSGVRDLLNNQTILDGQFQRRILFTGDQAPHVAFDKVTKVDGFVLQRGSSSYGSAVAMSVGTVLENCIIRNNNGSTFGAAVFVKLHATLSNPTPGWNIGGALINCIIVNNTSSDRAAGIFVNQDTHISIINCVIANNRSTDTSTGVGGVLVQNNIRWSRISNNIIYNNESPVSGRNNFFNPGVNSNQTNNDIKFQAIWSNYLTDFNTMYLATEVLDATPAHGNLTATNFADPLFEMPTTFRGHSNDAELRVQIENSNWRLASNSPLIGLGSTLSGRVDVTYPYNNSRFNNVARAFTTVTTDVMGNTRIINSTVEMGAYEYDPITSSVISSNASHGTVNANQEVSKGSTITQTATPEAGHRFINWTENDTEVSTDQTYSFMALTNRNLVANFASNTVNLTAATNASATALNNCEDCDVTLDEGAVLDVDINKTFNSITVKPGAGISLQSGKNLTPGTLILESTAQGTATLVDKTTTSPQAVTATIEQYMPQGRNWYVGAPVGGAVATTLTAAGLAGSVSYYDEVASSWVNGYTGALTPGRGYVAVSSEGSGTNKLSFSGTLNTGQVQVNLTRQGTVKSGFNLVANPYPSYLNAMEAINANENLESTLWYRTKGSAYYFETVNTASGIGTNNAGTGTVTGIIPPLQAFWVRTTLDNQNLIFANSMRYHAHPQLGEETVTTTPLKAPGTSYELVRLEISNGTNRDETVLYFSQYASNDLDRYDSPKMFNENRSIPEIYTLAGGEKLAINGLASYSYTTVMPLGYYAGQQGQYSIRLTETVNLHKDTRIVLRDKLTGQQQDITDGAAYYFDSSSTVSEDRFEVVFSSVSGITGQYKPDDFNIGLRIHEQSIYIDTNMEINLSATVEIYTTAGQRIQSQALTAKTIIRNLVTGSYILVMTVRDQRIVHKVIIN